MDGSKKWTMIDKETQSLLEKLGSNFEEYLKAYFLPKNDIYGDFPEDVYEASEKMGGKRLSVMSSYADPLGYYNKVGEIKGKLLADSKHMGETSSRLAVINESARKHDAGEKNSDGPPEIPPDASNKAQSTIASTNSEKPSNKRKRQ